MREAVSNDVTLLVTDEWIGYNRIWTEYPSAVIRHTKGEYVSGVVHTQTIEGYWSQLKRQIYGIHHWVSEKHLGATWPSYRGVTIYATAAKATG